MIMDIRVPRDEYERVARQLEETTTLVGVNLHPPASGPEVELTFRSEFPSVLERFASIFTVLARRDRPEAATLTEPNEDKLTILFATQVLAIERHADGHVLVYVSSGNEKMDEVVLDEDAWSLVEAFVAGADGGRYHVNGRNGG